MPDDANRPNEPQRDINGNPIPPPSFPPPARPLPGNSQSSSSQPSSSQPSSSQPSPDQKYDLAGNPIPPAGGLPPAQPPYYGAPPTGQAPAWPPPPQAGPYGQAAGPYGQPGIYPVQVKGSQILTMGILSFLCFGIILGPMAFVQGTKALAAIDRGEADPSQRGQVSAGRICGLIGGILSLILIIVRSGAIISAISHGGR